MSSCVYILIGVDNFMKSFAQDPSHLMVTRIAARGASYKAKDSGAYIAFGKGVIIILLMAVYMWMSCAHGVIVRKMYCDCTHGMDMHVCSALVHTCGITRVGMGDMCRYIRCCGGITCVWVDDAR